MAIQINMRPFGNQDHGGPALNGRDRQIACDIVCFVDTQVLPRDLVQGGSQFSSSVVATT